MANNRNNRNRNRNRNRNNRSAEVPSSAELARREAQSREDRGEGPRDIEVMGVQLSVDPVDLDDYDALKAMDNGDCTLILDCMFPDEDEREAALDSLREPSGKLRYSNVLKFVQEVFTALGQGK